MLGGVSLGWFDSLNDATNRIVKEGMIVTPDQELVETYDEKFDAFLGSLKRMYIEK
jgi:gluconokinase